MKSVCAWRKAEQGEINEEHKTSCLIRNTVLESFGRSDLFIGGHNA